MGDEDNGLAALAQTIDDLEEELDLLRGQNGGRLVKNQDVGLAVEHLQNLNTLTHGNLNILDLVGGIHFQTVGSGELCDLLVGLLHIYHGEDAEGPLFGLHTQNDIFRHGIVVHQLEVLVHHADRVGGGIVGRAHLHTLAVNNDLAGVRLIHAKEHTHEGGLAGAVFA